MNHKNRTLAVCLVLTLLWLVLGKLAFDITLWEATATGAVVIASFYFGRWVRRNAG